MPVESQVTMSSDVSSSLPPSKRLTLRRILGAIAGSALAFASLPWLMSIPLVVAVFGILGLDGTHPPVVTSGDGVRRWVPWAVWSFGLAACPIAIAVVGTVYEYHGPPVYDRWAARVVEWLGLTHLGIMVIASVVVVVLTAGSYRWLAWAAILAVGVLGFLLYFGAAMATTGAYL
jgi:hypothetical protein